MVRLLLALWLLAQSSAGWQATNTGQVDSSLTGVIDSPADGATIAASGLLNLHGWFVDTTAQGWAGADAVQVFSGSMSSGTRLAQGSVGLNRPDVAASMGNPFWAASGWTATLDGSQLTPGALTLSVNIHTPGKGWFAHNLALTVVAGATLPSGEILAPAPAAQGPLPNLTVLSPRPGEAISTSNRQYVISGTAFNPSGGMDGVEVWLNGEANADGATFLGLADVKSDGSWSLTFDPAQFDRTDANLYVYARSATTGRRRLVVVHFQITSRR